MICTRLIFNSRKHSRPLSKIDDPLCFEFFELPSNKRVIIRVNICGNEGSSPVNANTEHFEILFRNLWKVIAPVFRVLERGDFFIFYVTLFKNTINTFGIFLVVLSFLGLVIFVSSF